MIYFSKMLEMQALVAQVASAMAADLVHAYDGLHRGGEPDQADLERAYGRLQGLLEALETLPVERVGR